jgi:SAM-dependent methyltransferase
MSITVNPDGSFSINGYCSVCGSQTLFQAANDWFRDQLICTNCGSVPRERALAMAIEKWFPAWRESAIHESSPSERFLTRKFKTECAGYIASQFYPEIPTGTDHMGFKCEDLRNLSFEDESIDLHITQDVIEHVFENEKVFIEIARTLKPGGAHIFTVPLVNGSRKSEVAASLDSDGKLIHHHEPEYHGNPVADEGALVTMKWGFDIVDKISATSGMHSIIVDYHSPYFGILGEYHHVVVSIKPNEPE